jgi:hypothetical protein
MLPNNKMFQDTDDHQIHARGYEYNRQEVTQQYNMQQVFASGNMEEYFFDESSQQQQPQPVEEPSHFYNDNEFKLTHHLNTECHSYLEKINSQTSEAAASVETSPTPDSSIDVPVRHIRPGMPRAPPSDEATETQTGSENVNSDLAITDQTSLNTRVRIPTPPPSSQLSITETPASILTERSWPPKKQQPDLTSNFFAVQYYDEEMDETYELYRQYVYLGVVDADPETYYATYGDELVQREDIEPYVAEMKSRPECLMFADECDEDQMQPRHHDHPYELVGDVEALRLIDLDQAGLGMYKSLIEQLTSQTAATETMNSGFNQHFGPKVSSMFEEEIKQGQLHEMETAKMEEVEIDEDGAATTTTNVSSIESESLSFSKKMLSSVVEE